MIKFFEIRNLLIQSLFFKRGSNFFTGLDNPRSFYYISVPSIYKAKCIFYSNTILWQKFSCSAPFCVDTCENIVDISLILTK